LTKLILASHGNLSKGMLNSVKMIVGNMADDVESFSVYPGENPNDYATELRERIRKNQDQQFIIACDIKGGSVYNAILQTCVYDNVELLSGMNMNMILELVLAINNQNMNLQQIIADAKKGIELENKETLKVDIEEEDF